MVWDSTALLYCGVIVVDWSAVLTDLCLGHLDLLDQICWVGWPWNEGLKDISPAAGLDVMQVHASPGASEACCHAT